jgi:hypothetical protein
MKEKLSTLAVIRHEVQVRGGLKRVTQLHDERIIYGTHNTSLRSGVFNLLSSLHHGLAKYLHRIDLSIPQETNQKDLTERSLTHDLQQLEIFHRDLTRTPVQRLGMLLKLQKTMQIHRTRTKIHQGT